MTDKRICLNKSTLDFMDSVLTKESFVLEFGAGWSSRWLADRCGWLDSVETSTKWHKLVEDDIQGSDCSWKVTDSVPRETVYNLSLVDSPMKYRADDIKQAWSRLRPGGWMILDDAQRFPYRKWCELYGPLTMLGWHPDHDLESAKDRISVAWRK